MGSDVGAALGAHTKPSKDPPSLAPFAPQERQEDRLIHDICVEGVGGLKLVVQHALQS